MPLEEKKKYTCIEGLLHLFLFLNSKMTELTLQFEKTKAICEIGFVFIFRFCQGRLGNLSF
jgi:hypothetical protein